LIVANQDHSVRNGKEEFAGNAGRPALAAVRAKVPRCQGDDPACPETGEYGKLRVPDLNPETGEISLRIGEFMRPW
jgi:hypothetical protein